MSGVHADGLASGITNISLRHTLSKVTRVLHIGISSLTYVLLVIALLQNLPH
jgi:ABC-type uncharacterized transport system permease subunit